MAHARAKANRSADVSISFPSLSQIRSRALSDSPASPSSPSSAGSPLSPSRPTAAKQTNSHDQPYPSPHSLYSPDLQADAPMRAPMSRLTSSATLFFGPAIPNPRSRSHSRSRTRPHTLRNITPPLSASASTKALTVKHEYWQQTACEAGGPANNRPQA